MSEVSFSTKKTEIEQEDLSWYKQYCRDCPYFFSNGEFEIIRCESNRPCLVTGILVPKLIIKEAARRMINEKKKQENQK
jgi:hypothetical protein